VPAFRHLMNRCSTARRSVRSTRRSDRAAHLAGWSRGATQCCNPAIAAARTATRLAATIACEQRCRPGCRGPTRRLCVRPGGRAGDPAADDRMRRQVRNALTAPMAAEGSPLTGRTGRRRRDRLRPTQSVARPWCGPHGKSAAVIPSACPAGHCTNSIR
jgi:hypothetical protein